MSTKQDITVSQSNKGNWVQLSQPSGYQADCGHFNLLTWARSVTQSLEVSIQTFREVYVKSALILLYRGDLAILSTPFSQFEYCTRIGRKRHMEERKSMSNKKGKGRLKTILHLGLVLELGQDLLTLGAGRLEVTNHVESSCRKTN